MKVNDSVFRAYDIRGRFPDEVDAALAYGLGRAYPAFIGAQKLVVGSDFRQSSEPLKNALIKGLVESGVEVVDMGFATTPMFYFAIANRKFDGGIMVSASHNPPQYNGFKLVKKNAVAVSGSQLQALKSFIKEKKLSDFGKKGRLEREDFAIVYIDFILSLVSINAPELKVVMDAGNGVAGIILPLLKKSLAITIEPMFWGIDSKFSNRPPNPLAQGALESLKARVQSTKANFGVAFDVDADRAVFVDEKGEFVRPDLITALLAKDYLAGHRRGEGKIIYDVRTSHVVPEIVEVAGGKPLLSPVGRTIIQKKMHETGALFAGEVSGHYYFKELGGFDDGVFAALKIIELLAHEKKSLSKLIMPLQKYYQSPELNFEIQNSKKLIEKLASEYSSGKISELDGLTVEFGDWWFNIRASHTEPLARLSIEANSKDLLEERQKELITKINE